MSVGTATTTDSPAAEPVRKLDPIGAIAAVLITASVLWRASITTRGYLTTDDFPIIAQADEFGLGGLFTLYNNHFMPAGRLITYLVNELTGYEYWPYATLMLLGQIAVSILFYRLLRLMLPYGWALLVPLALFLFNPLTLEISAWWAVGLNLLPMQIAMIVALGAQVKYVRTGEHKHLVTLGVTVVVALLFFEKALLIVPLVFLTTLFLYAPGGPVRAVLTTIRRWWPAWAMLTAISLLFLAVYLAMATGSSLRVPQSADEVRDFLVQFFGSSLASGLLGGPWSWLDASDGPAVAAPTETAQYVSWALIAVLIAITVWLRRGVAARAWALMVVFAAMAAGLIAFTRLGSEMSGVAGLVPRYLGDVFPLAALCVGVAVCGLRRPGPGSEPVDDPLPGAAHREQHLQRRRLRHRLGVQGRPRLSAHRAGRDRRRRAGHRLHGSAGSRAGGARPGVPVEHAVEVLRAGRERAGVRDRGVQAVGDRRFRSRPARLGERCPQQARAAAGLRLSDHRRSDRDHPAAGRRDQLLAGGADRLPQ
jgi:hypothetical protein